MMKSYECSALSDHGYFDLENHQVSVIDTDTGVYMVIDSFESIVFRTEADTCYEAVENYLNYLHPYVIVHIKVNGEWVETSQTVKGCDAFVIEDCGRNSYEWSYHEGE